MYSTQEIDNLIRSVFHLRFIRPSMPAHGNSGVIQSTTLPSKNLYTLRYHVAGQDDKTAECTQRGLVHVPDNIEGSWSIESGGKKLGVALMTLRVYE